MKPWHSAVPCVLALLSFGASGAPVSIACPASIATSDAVVAAPAAWEVVVDESKGGRTLEQVLVFTGHPREMGSLKPDKSVPGKGKLVSTWLLSQPAERGGYWVGCAYRNSTTLLAHPLPVSAKSCRLTQRTLASGAVAGIESFSCE